MASFMGVADLPPRSDDPAAYARAYAKRKRILDPDYARRQSEAARQWQLANPVRNSWNQGKAGARKRKLEWSLSRAQHESLVLGDCYYCGHGVELPKINGVDRVDSSAGYTPTNVVSACWRCNYAKRDMSIAEFYDWIDSVAQHRRRDGELQQI